MNEGYLSGGNSGNLTGSTYNWTAPYGGKPNVPDPIASARAALAGNAANLPAMESIAGGVNSFNTDQMSATLASMIPNYEALRTSQSDVIGSELAGVIPTDVLALIAQQGAERGVATGSPGSDNSSAAWLRALGLTSIGQQQTGISNLATTIGETPLPKQFDMSGLMLSPEDYQSAAMAANLYAAAPDPAAAAQAAIQAARSGLTSSTPPGTSNWASINPSSSSSPKSGSRTTSVPYLGTQSGSVGGVDPFSPPPPQNGVVTATGPQDQQSSVDPYQIWWDSTFGTNRQFYGSGNQGNQGSWNYDSTMGVYVNSLTGELFDQFGTDVLPPASESYVGTTDDFYGP